jgi:hypothetical protein
MRLLDHASGCTENIHARRLTRVTRYRSPASCTGARPAAAPAQPAMPAPPAAAEARAIDSGFQAFWPRRASVAAAVLPDTVPLCTRACQTLGNICFPCQDWHLSCKQHRARPPAVLMGGATRNKPHLTRCNVKSSSAGAAAASAAALAVSCAVRRSASCPAAFSSRAPCSARSSRSFRTGHHSRQGPQGGGLPSQRRADGV